MLIDPLLTSLLLALCKNTFSLDSFPPFYNVSSVGGSTDQYEVLLGVYERKHNTSPTHDMFPVYKKINLVFTYGYLYQTSAGMFSIVQFVADIIH